MHAPATHDMDMYLFEGYVVFCMCLCQTNARTCSDRGKQLSNVLMAILLSGYSERSQAIRVVAVQSWKSPTEDETSN